MAPDRQTLPPVRLRSDAELARDALATPLLARAVRLARWAGPQTRVGAGGELVEEQLPAAAELLGLADDPDAEAYVSEAWRIAVDIGLLDVHDGQEGDEAAEGAEDGTVTPGENLATVTAGSPRTSSGSGWRASTPSSPTPPRPSSTTSTHSSARTVRSTSRPWTGTRRARPSSWRACSATCTC